MASGWGQEGIKPHRVTCGSGVGALLGQSRGQAFAGMTALGGCSGGRRFWTPVLGQSDIIGEEEAQCGHAAGESDAGPRPRPSFHPRLSFSPHCPAAVDSLAWLSSHPRPVIPAKAGIQTPVPGQKPGASSLGQSQGQAFRRNDKLSLNTARHRYQFPGSRVWLGWPWQNQPVGQAECNFK